MYKIIKVDQQTYVETVVATAESYYELSKKLDKLQEMADSDDSCTDSYNMILPNGRLLF